MGNYTLVQLGQQMLSDWPKKKKASTKNLLWQLTIIDMYKWKNNKAPLKGLSSIFWLFVVWVFLIFIWINVAMYYCINFTTPM